MLVGVEVADAQLREGSHLNPLLVCVIVVPGGEHEPDVTGIERDTQLRELGEGHRDLCAPPNVG